jgi:positive regulator of sigma E activity
MNSKTIEHIGTVSSISPTETKVSIGVQSACAGCHASSACGVVDSKSRAITVQEVHPEISVGDEVKVIGSRSMGLKAVFLAYILPLLIVLATLVISLFIFDTTDQMAGVISIGVLVPYYTALQFLKKKLSNDFTFRIIQE